MFREILESEEDRFSGVQIKQILEGVRLALEAWPPR